MDQGQVVEEGPPARIFGNPHQARTAAFLHRVLHPGVADANAHRRLRQTAAT